MHTTEVLDNLGVIVIRYNGQVEYEEIRSALDELVHVPGFRAGMHLIADFRNCQTPLSGNEVRQLADYAERTDAIWGQSKWVILAHNDTTYGLARMYAALTSTYRVTTRVFRDAHDVNGWLGLGLTIEEILATPAQMSLALHSPRQSQRADS